MDGQVSRLTPLKASTSNLAQMGYLTLGLLLIRINVRHRLIGRSYIAIAFWVGVVTGVAVYLCQKLGMNWPHELFDNSPRVFYAEQGGRFRGQFAELSHRRVSLKWSTLLGSAFQVGSVRVVFRC